MDSDNEKEERKKNIIIKGTDIPGGGIEIDGKERGKWIKRFIKERLEVECSLLEDKWNSDSD